MGWYPEHKMLPLEAQRSIEAWVCALEPEAASARPFPGALGPENPPFGVLGTVACRKGKTLGRWGEHVLHSGGLAQRSGEASDL